MLSKTRDQGVHKHAAASKWQSISELDSVHAGCRVWIWAGFNQGGTESYHFPASIHAANFESEVDSVTLPPGWIQPRGGRKYCTLTPDAGKMLDSVTSPPPGWILIYTDIHCGDCTKGASHWASSCRPLKNPDPHVTLPDTTTVHTNDRNPAFIWINDAQGGLIGPCKESSCLSISGTLEISWKRAWSVPPEYCYLDVVEVNMDPFPKEPPAGAMVPGRLAGDF